MITKSESNFGKVTSIAWLLSNEIENRIKDLSAFTDSITPIASSSGFENIYFTPGTLEINASNNEGNAGDSYAYDISFEVPRDRALVEQTIAEMKRRNFVLKVSDEQGTVRTFDVQRVKSKLKKSSKPETAAGYILSLSSEMIHPALYM
jgi:hypothetical protein